MMKMKILVLPLLLVLLHSVYSIPPPHRVSDILGSIIQQQQQQQQQQQKDDGPRVSDYYANVKNDDLSDVETLFFDQRLNHFSNDTLLATSTFKQRFFYSSRYANAASSSGRKNTNNAAPLAFLCVGGEGPDLDESVLVDSVHCTGDMIELAKKLHVEHGREVHLFALEHRYYGKSFPNETAVDYSFLSSRQAVRDIIAFVQSREVQQLMTTRGRSSAGDIDVSTLDQRIKIPASLSSSSSSTIFITFGGSYPGMLAAWSRLLHPEIIFAAVSNSAPIQAQLEFPEYYERVGYDLENEDIGGSAVCRSIVEEGHAQVAAILEKGELNNSSSLSPQRSGENYGDLIREYDLDRVATLFNVCGGSEMLRASRRNLESFVGDGLIAIPAQSNNPHCKGDLCNVEKLCSTIVNERNLNSTKPSIEILAQISMLQDNVTCRSVDWSAYLDYLLTPSIDDINEKSWLYQTCAEFGFYMTCNVDSRCPFGKGFNDVTKDLELCQVVFGIDPEIVKQNVDSTLAYYGGLNLTPNTGEGSNSGGGNGQKRIIFVNGDADPWTALALTKGTVDHPSFLVQGASHHFWTHSVKDNDGVFVVNARRTIYSIVSDWLVVSMLDTDSMVNWSVSME